MTQTLTLTTTQYTPTTPSLLSIPPSPTDPTPAQAQTYPRLRLLLTSSSSSSFSTNAASLNGSSQKDNKIHTTPPPPSPLPWQWQCHLCHRTYRLGVTQRCLDDGHLFCSGSDSVSTSSLSSTSTSGCGSASGKKRSKQTRRKVHRACASEFDYAGWKVWGEWSRAERNARTRSGNEETQAHTGHGNATRHCATACDYPSECRWGPLSVQRPSVVSPLTPLTPTTTTSTASTTSAPREQSHQEASSAVGAKPATSFEEILGLFTSSRDEPTARTGVVVDVDVVMHEPGNGDGDADMDMSDATVSPPSSPESPIEKINPLTYVRSYSEVQRRREGEMGVVDASRGSGLCMPAWLSA